MTFETTIERAAAQTQCLGGLADVALKAGQGISDEMFFHVIKGHVLEMLNPFMVNLQPQVGATNNVILCHQDAAFNGMLEFADIARPRTVEQRLPSGIVETRDLLPVAEARFLQELSRQYRDVFTPLTKRRNLDFYRVQAEQKILAKSSRFNLFLQICVRGG